MRDPVSGRLVQFTDRSGALLPPGEQRSGSGPWGAVSQLMVDQAAGES